MDIPKGFYEMVCGDIDRLANAEKLESEKLLELHREIDGRYQACVNNGMMACGVPQMMETILRMDI